jgi:hypothetical protein
MKTETKPTTKAVAQVITRMEVAKIPNGFDQKQVQKFRDESRKIYDLAEAMVITDVQTKDTAEALARSCAEMKKKVKAAFKAQLDEAVEEKRAATTKKAAVDAVIDTLTQILDEAQRVTDRKAREYINTEKKRIDDENRKALLEAQKKAEDDRKDEVAELKEIGTPEARRAARELAAAPVTAATVQLQEKITASKGTVYQAKWIAEVASGDQDQALFELVQAAAKNPAKFIKYLMLNWPAINRAAVADKDKFDVPGFTARDEGKTLHRS